MDNKKTQDREMREAIAHITQTLARFVEGFEQGVETLLGAYFPVLEEIANRVENITQAWIPIYETVRESYREQGAIYGDTHDGLMRWLRELSEVERLRAEADVILDRQEMLRYLAIRMQHGKKPRA